MTVQWKAQVDTDFRELETLRLPSPLSDEGGSSTARDALEGFLTKEEYLWALGTVRAANRADVKKTCRRVTNFAPISRHSSKGLRLGVAVICLLEGRVLRLAAFSCLRGPLRHGMAEDARTQNMSCTAARFVHKCLVHHSRISPRRFSRSDSVPYV